MCGTFFGAKNRFLHNHIESEKAPRAKEPKIWKKTNRFEMKRNESGECEYEKE